MIFKNIYIESDVKEHDFTKNILRSLKATEYQEIDKIENYWGKVKKPYLQKRDTLNLFIGEKKGALIKKAPHAYGFSSEPHYYFIHAYNCIYECQYCYLQGYFNSPDIVLFTNHHDIINQMKNITDEVGPCWFHAGEYSDSLALSHLTNEWPLYWKFFENNPDAKLELRTKSSNIKAIEKLTPLENVCVTFSLSDAKNAKNFDLKTPPIETRLKAIKKLVDSGFRIGIHYDPIVYHPDYLKTYKEITDKLKDILPDGQLSYISLGVVRFTKEVYNQVKQNYPQSKISHQPFIKSFDGKVRYTRPLRSKILNEIKQQLIDAQYLPEKIYLCMED
ncbi:MAG: hypothetical protein H6621_12530 [Halobacteriovoraceae bacterium]|nr:hypothetical protein [Halobacteriovoraceae bacterium]